MRESPGCDPKAGVSVSGGQELRWDWVRLYVSYQEWSRVRRWVWVFWKLEGEEEEEEE